MMPIELVVEALCGILAMLLAWAIYPMLTKGR